MTGRSLGDTHTFPGGEQAFGERISHLARAEHHVQLNIHHDVSTLWF
jgi:hypothetical protein